MVEADHAIPGEGLTQTPCFELRDVSKHFAGVTALDKLSFNVYPRERIALIGPSGAGKSTLLSLLNGAQFASEGSVHAFGHDLSQLSARRLRLIQRQIGTIYQQFQLVNNLAVIHNVNAGHLGYWSFPRAAFSLLRPLDVETARQALTAVGIEDKLYARTDRLSGGQQQRVAIARVLVQNPRVILADEPVASLDPARSTEILALLGALVDEMDKTLICSVHTVQHVFAHFTRVIGLRQGQVLFDRPVTELAEAQLTELYDVG